jgi:hypothetical protein
MLLLPKIGLAAVRISEIMYDPPGTDTTHEWIEIENDSEAPIDISGWKLFEANSNHALTSIAGGTILAAHGFAIIADNASVFQNDYPQFGGMLFDSVFSLANSGETLVLKDAAGVVVDEAIYTSEAGAVGDGNTLQGSQSAWVTAIATPGAPKATTPPPNTNDDTNDDTNNPPNNEDPGDTTNTPTTNTPPSTNTGGEKSKPPKKIVAKITLPTGSVLSDGNTHIQVKITGSDGELANRGRVVWNFGDGESIETFDLTAVGHIYAFPGRYVINLSYYEFYFDLEPKATDRATILVSAPSLLFSDDGMYLSLKNTAKNEVDISRWEIVSSATSFIFPKGTVLLAGSMIVISKNKAKLEDTHVYKLLFPNGNTATTTDIVPEIPIEEANEKTVQPVPASIIIPAVPENQTGEVAPEVEVENTLEQIIQKPAVEAAVATSLPEVAKSKSEGIPRKSIYILVGIIISAALFGIAFNRAGRERDL